jgi:hypothetical protein
MSTITTPVTLTNAPIVIISHLLCAHPHPCLNNLPEDNVHPSRAIKNSGSLQTHKNSTDANEKEKKNKASSLFASVIRSAQNAPNLEERH